MAWAIAELERAGLERVRAEPAPATLWSRGPEAGSIIVPRRHTLSLTALGGSVATPSGGVDAEVVEMPSLDALDAADPSALAGKIVYLHHVMPRLRDGTGYNAGSLVRTSGPSRAARKGAAACLVRSIGTDSVRAPHTGALFYQPGAPEIPAAALAIPDAELLHRMLAGGASVRVSLSLGCEPLPVGLSHNVIGELRGSDSPEEIVLVGAHLDSWDLSVGALDDGAGVAIAIEAARRIASLPRRPRRTIRIALFANEELGTGGGLAYAKAYAEQAKHHVVAMEADQGDGKPWALRVPADVRDHRLTSRLREVLSPMGIDLDPGPARGGVDISPLRELGVRFVDLRQDASKYFDFHHTENDVLENVSRSDLDATARAFAVTAFTFADAEERW